MKKKTTTALLLGLSLTISAWSVGTPQEEDASVRTFGDAKVIRVHYAEGEAFVERQSEEGWEDLVENLPIFEGDYINTEEGRVELYLGRLNYLRIDRNSRLEISQAPILRGTSWSVDLVSGSIILDLRQLDTDSQALARTPDCEILFVTPGVFRIDSSDQGESSVRVIEGMVEVYSDDGETRLDRGQRLNVTEGQITQNSGIFTYNYDDDFMRFHEDRTRGAEITRTIGSRHLEGDLEEFETEMNRHGRWEYSPIYGCHIWYPYGLGFDWQPYANGRWVYHPVYGYVWTSYDACGWITHHYGRWHWQPGVGWYWIPGYRWSPAWVFWGWDRDYYCWVPLGHDNRPVIVINKRWLRDYNHRQGLPVHASSVVVVRRDKLRSHRIADFTTRKIGSDLVEDRLHFHGQGPAVIVGDSLLYGKTRNGVTVLIKQGGVTRTRVGGPVPVTVVKKENQLSPSENTLRSIRRVIREKSHTEGRIDSGSSSGDSYRGSSGHATVKKSSGAGKSSRVKTTSKAGSGSKTVVKKKKK